MHEIKLRAYDTFNEHMVYSSDEGATFILKDRKWSIKYVVEKNTTSNGIEADVPVWKESNELELMEYIGLKDKKGNEIYEGDIGELKSQSGRIERFVVKRGIHRRKMLNGWTVDIPGFCFEMEGFASFPIVENYLNGHDLDIIEIIGNIYEKSELLKAS